MGEITIIGIDLAKNVFQLHGVSADGRVLLRRQLRRGQVLGFFVKLAPCLIGIEACAGAHFWARELIALGHDVRLMPPSYVKAYVKRGKTDAADAEAICEAVTRPSMRFVPVKTEAQQAVLLAHRTRDFLVRQLTQIGNSIRAHLGEFGLVVAKGVHNVERLLEAGEGAGLPVAAQLPIRLLAEQFRETRARVETITREIEAGQKGRRDRQAPGHDTWRWHHDVFGHRSDHAGSDELPLGPRLRGLARAHAEAPFERRERTPRTDLEDGQPIHPPASLPRRHGADQCETQARSR